VREGEGEGEREGEREKEKEDEEEEEEEEKDRRTRRRRRIEGGGEKKEEGVELSGDKEGFQLRPCHAEKFRETTHETVPYGSGRHPGLRLCLGLASRAKC
jgi:hypothetical protein